MFDVASLVIFGQVFGPQQVARIFGFSSFYFVGLGWFVVCVSVVLFSENNLHYNGETFVNNWGLIPP
jgi:hypothetical protein